MSLANQPVVSVILCVLNGEATIAQAIESVLAQTYSDFEFLIVDDGSMDATSSLLEEFRARDSRIRVFTNPTNMGISYSANRAFAAARGRYIMRCDADDWSTPDRLAKQVAVLDHRPEVGVILSRVVLVEEGGKHIESEYETIDPSWSGELFRIKLCGNCPINNGEALIRKSLLDQVKYYRPEFPLAEDYDLWLRLSMITDFAVIDEVHYYRRLHARSVTRRHRQLHAALSFLARECHFLRLQGLDDAAYLQAESLRLRRKWAINAHQQIRALKMGGDKAAGQ